LCDQTEISLLKSIEKLIKIKIPTERFQGVPEEELLKTIQDRKRRHPPGRQRSPERPQQQRPEVGYKFRNRK
jgi:hypothetical protein